MTKNTFVYSIKFIGHWTNVLCDGMGSWKQTESIQNTLNVQDIKQEISSKLKDDLISCDNLKSIRHKFVNSTSPDLHRVVIHLEQVDGTVLDKVFVQYYFDKEPHYFQPIPHGNSKINERQVKEMQNYCTNMKNFSIMGVDTPFNIGAFYVTFTTYRNIMLTTKQGTEPVMI